MCMQEDNLGRKNIKGDKNVCWRKGKDCNLTHGSILSCLQSETKDKPKHPYNKCFQCEDKPPRKGSLYCSNECQTKHAKFNVPVGILKVTVDKVILHDISSSLITLFSLIVTHQDYQPF